MKILFVCQYYSPEPFKVAELCAELGKQGHFVTVLTGIPNYPEGKPYPGYGWFSKRYEFVENIEIRRIPIIYRGNTRLQLMFNFVSFALLGAWYALNLRERFDRVFIYQLSPIFMAIPGIVYGRIHKVPIKMYVLDLWPDSYFETEKSDNRILKSILYGISKWIYRSASAIGISSRGFRESIVDMGVSSGKILYVPQYHEDPYPSKGKQGIPKEASDIDGQMKILFTGNIGFAQRLGIVLDAAEVTKRTSPNIHWILVGEGRAKATLVAECKRRKLGDVVHFERRIKSSEVVSLLRTADAALLVLGKTPLFSRTVPAKLQTYMACGMPILASVNGESARIIDEADCGLLSPAEDGLSLGLRAVELFNSSHEKLFYYSCNARKYYLENFSKENHLKGIDEILSKT
jgi:glycosyltransferase involved in cell wall biosynthesis